MWRGGDNGARFWSGTGQVEGEVRGGGGGGGGQGEGQGEDGRADKGKGLVCCRRNESTRRLLDAILDAVR